MRRILSVLAAVALWAFPAHATISDNDPWVQYTWTSGAQTFTYNFKLYEFADLVVLRNAAADSRVGSCGTLGQFTVTGTSNGGLDPDEGGTVTMCGTLTSGDIITLYRDLDRERTTDFRAGAAMSAATLNDQLDRQAAYAQEEEYQRNTRMLIFPLSDAEFTNELPPAATRASKFVCFDASGNAQVCSGTAGPVDGLTDVEITNAAEGDILYNDTTNWVNLARGNNGNLLTLSSGIPAWVNRTVTAGTALSGGGSLGSNITINYAGGLDDQSDLTITTPTRGDVLTRGASEWGNLALGTNGQVLQSDGTDAIWATIAAGTFDGLTDTNLTAIAIGDVFYWDGTDVVNLAIGTDGQRLTAGVGPAAPKWVTPDFSDLAGTLTHEQGGLEADVSAYAGLVRIDSGSTTNITNLAGLDTALGSSIMEDLVDDASPQLGANLDVNGNEIRSESNGNIGITPNGSGSVVLDGQSWPQADGNAGESLVTDGAAQLSWAGRMRFVQRTDTTDFRIILDTGMSDTNVSLLVSSVSTQTVTYQAGSATADEEAVLDGLNTGNIGQYWLLNSTRSQVVRVDNGSWDTGANTFEVDTDYNITAWANNDVITLKSDLGAMTAADIISVSLKEDVETEGADGARFALMRFQISDTGGSVGVGIYETATALQQISAANEITGFQSEFHSIIPLSVKGGAEEYTFSFLINATGSETARMFGFVLGYLVQ